MRFESDIASTPRERYAGFGVCASIAIVFAIGLAGSPALLVAQVNTAGTYADPTNPSGPPGPTKDVQIWKVDPISGSLSINIPLLNLAPGGRGPRIPYSLLYNSASTTVLSSNLIPPQGSYDPSLGHTEYVWTGPLLRTQPRALLLSSRGFASRGGRIRGLLPTRLRPHSITSVSRAR